MIHDGYTRFAEIRDGENVVRIAYRPLLRHEREWLGSFLTLLDDEGLALEFYGGVVQERVLNFTQLSVGLSPRIHDAMLDAVMGRNPQSTEERDAKNLAQGVRLLVRYPHMQKFSCQDCAKWQLDPRTGNVSTRGGKKLERMEEDILLCRTPRGCPRGTLEEPQDLSAKNRKALRHYLECRATGQFPADPIVKHNARIIANELRNAGRVDFTV